MGLVSRALFVAALAGCARAPSPSAASPSPTVSATPPAVAPTAPPIPGDGGLPRPADSVALAPSPPSSGAPSLEDELARARALGFGAAADVVATRVRQERRKMKLEPEEGARAAGYLADELPRMPRASELLPVMPKTTVELVRSVRERGVEAPYFQKLYRPAGSLP